jgi:hypothetical protein
MVDEDPNAEVDWGNREEIDSDDDDNDDISEGDDMDESGEGSDEEDTIDDTVVEKFIRTFHIGGYDVELDNPLSLDRDQNVTVPGRPAQESYTKPDDWRERNRIGLEEVKEQLQDCIFKVSYSASFNLDLIHNGSGIQQMDNEERIVWNEPILDEYWNQLDAKMKQLCNNRQISRWIEQTIIGHVKIMNVEMKKERLATLVTALSGEDYATKYILFNNANLCAEGIIYLSKLVDVSYQLQALTINHNWIDDMDSARSLTKSLRSHWRIQSLDLSYCDLGSSPEILSVILQSEVKHIHLNNNNIDSLGAVEIAEYLESDPPNYSISLNQNRLNDDDAILISRELKRNTKLKGINLLMNNLTSIGVKALLNCVFDSSSLNAISESNHTLAEMNFFDYSNRPKSLVSCIGRLLKLDCTQKIILALQDKDSLLKYFANVPMELIPEVLAFPLQQDGYQCEHEHLNIVYSTMRWWNMPMLYFYYNNCVNSD